MKNPLSSADAKVKPVRSGARVALTFSLQAEPVDVPSPTEFSDLEESLQAFLEDEECMVYLLDHLYTEQSIGWERLKNTGGARAAALRDVAETLDCECFLALGELRETYEVGEEDDDGDDDDDGTAILADEGGDEEEYADTREPDVQRPVLRRPSDTDVEDSDPDDLTISATSEGAKDTGWAASGALVERPTTTASSPEENGRLPPHPYSAAATPCRRSGSTAPTWSSVKP